MRQARTVRARIEHAQLDDPTFPSTASSVALWCQTPSGRYFETSIGFNTVGRGVAGRRFGLLKHLLASHGMAIEQGWQTQFRCLIGRYFAFRLVEFQPHTYLIEKAKAVEAFAIEEGDEAALRALMEAESVR